MSRNNYNGPTTSSGKSIGGINKSTNRNRNRRNNFSNDSTSSGSYSTSSRSSSSNSSIISSNNINGVSVGEEFIEESTFDSSNGSNVTTKKTVNQTSKNINGTTTTTTTTTTLSSSSGSIQSNGNGGGAYSVGGLLGSSGGMMQPLPAGGPMNLTSAMQYPQGSVDNMMAPNVNRDGGGHFGNYTPFLSKDFMNNIIGQPRAPLGHMRPQDVYEQTQLRKQQMETKANLEEIYDDNDNDDEYEDEDDDNEEDDEDNTQQKTSSSHSNQGNSDRFLDFQDDEDEDVALQRAINESIRLQQQLQQTKQQTKQNTNNNQTQDQNNRQSSPTQQSQSKKSISSPPSKNNSPTINKPSLSSPNTPSRRKVRFGGSSPNDEINEYKQNSANYTINNNNNNNNNNNSNSTSNNNFNNSNKFGHRANNNYLNVSNESDDNEEEYYENNPDAQEFLSSIDKSRLENKKMIKDSRKIREQQEKEFNESLKKDREKKEEEELERALKLSMEIEQQSQIAIKRDRLPVDPTIGLSLDQIKASPIKICEVSISLPPDGTRITRKFYVNNTLQSIRDWVDVHLFDSNSPINLSTYELVTNFPKESLTDNSKTLLDLHLYPRAILNLREP